MWGILCHWLGIGVENFNIKQNIRKLPKNANSRETNQIIVIKEEGAYWVFSICPARKMLRQNSDYWVFDYGRDSGFLANGIVSLLMNTWDTAGTQLKMSFWLWNGWLFKKNKNLQLFSSLSLIFTFLLFLGSNGSMPWASHRKWK